MQLRQLFADTQRPDRLHSDNGREFDGAVKELCDRMGIATAHGKPYHPQTQVRTCRHTCRLAWELPLSPGMPVGGAVWRDGADL